MWKRKLEAEVVEAVKFLWKFVCSIFIFLTQESDGGVTGYFG